MGFVDKCKACGELFPARRSYKDLRVLSALPGPAIPLMFLLKSTVIFCAREEINEKRQSASGAAARSPSGRQRPYELQRRGFRLPHGRYQRTGPSRDLQSLAPPRSYAHRSVGHSRVRCAARLTSPRTSPTDTGRGPTKRQLLPDGTRLSRHSKPTSKLSKP